MKMNTLILVRHGEYNHETERLDNVGEVQINGLAINIEKIIKTKKTVALVSSNAAMAVDSAEIIAKKLCLSFKTEDIFFSNSEWYNLPQAFKKIQEIGENNEVVIVVTHHEYCKYLPQHIVFNKFKRYLYYTVTECGRAVILNLSRKSIEFLSNN